MHIARCVLFVILFYCAFVYRNSSLRTKLGLNYHIGSTASTPSHTWLFFHFSRFSTRYAPLSFPRSANFSQLVTLLLLSGDIALNPGPINFAFTNCRSIRNKHAGLLDLVTSKSIGIMGLTETHIRSTDTPSFLSELTPTGFKLLHVPRPIKLGGGVGFLINKSLNSTVVPSPVFDSFEHIIITVQWQNHSLNFVSVYRPPQLSCSDFLDDFMSLVGFTSSLQSQTIMSGDFNIHMDTSSKYSLSFQSMLDSCDFTQHINFPTHIHGHTLDLLITPTNFNGLSLIKSSECFSDHFCITAQLEMLPSITHTHKTISFRRYHKIDMDTLKYDLKNTEFVQSPACNVEDLFEQYNKSLSSVLDKHAPIVTKSLKKPAPIWITDNYREAKRIRRQYERAWRRNKTSLNRSRLRKQTNRCHNIINKS